METRRGFSASSGRPGASVSLTLEGREWRLAEHLGPGGSLVPVVDGRRPVPRLLGHDADGLHPTPRHGGARDDRRIETAAGYIVTGDRLELTDTAGAAILRFRAETGPGLLGTTWVAIGINNGRGGVVSSVAIEAARVTATFAEDGRVSGFGGCNGFGGSYTVDAASIRIGPLAATRKACVEPEGVGELEGWYYAALERAATWSIREDRLQLRDGDGALQVDYRLAGAEV